MRRQLLLGRHPGPLQPLCACLKLLRQLPCACHILSSELLDQSSPQVDAELKTRKDKKRRLPEDDKARARWVVSQCLLPCRNRAE